jgi:hypothetical protein
MMCASGQLECGGVCTPVLTDHGNCGSCGHACSGTERCDAGVCTPCASGGRFCFGECTEPLDRLNCGGCGLGCLSNQVCTASGCLGCFGGGLVCNNMCVGNNDPMNCGACGRTCAVDQRCNAGSCVPLCPPGQILCDGACRDPVNDRNHCGGCGHACGRMCAPIPPFVCVDLVCRASTCVPP